MSSPKLRTEAAAAGNYPEKRFNQRERKLLQSVSNAVKAGVAQISSSDLGQMISAEGVTDSYAASVQLNGNGATTAKIIAVTPVAGSLLIAFDSDPTGAIVQWVAVDTGTAPAVT